MRKVNGIDFGGMPIFCGIDVHKKSWRVNIRTADWSLEEFTQNPDANELVKHLRKFYPGAKYKLAYEAGFSGFHIQRSFASLGMNCQVINPADIPSSDKEKKRKNDKVDAKKISREMVKGTLTGIYVPSVAMEHARTLVRQRTRLVRDQTRCKSRIWHQVMFSGIRLEEFSDNKYWSARFIEYLKKVDCGSYELRRALDLALEEYILIRKLVLEATKEVRRLSRMEVYAPLQHILQSFPGIGVINAMIVMTEIQDMRRFRNLDALCSFVGIVPDHASSGEKETVKGITHRSNGYLRPAIVESSWVMIRKDPEMLAKFNKYRQRMNENKAIIKIAHHLLNRMRHLWLSGKTYEKGVNNKQPIVVV